MKVLDTHQFLDVCLTEVKEELVETEHKFDIRSDDEEQILNFEIDSNIEIDSNFEIEKTPIILLESNSEIESVKEEPTFVDVDQRSNILLYNCPECDYQAQVKYYILKHIQRCHKHLSESNMNFRCPYCDAQFQGLNRYHKHCSLEHSDKLPKVTCDICFKELSSSKSLLMHKKVAHNNEPDLKLKSNEKHSYDASLENYDVEKFRVGDNLNLGYQCEFCSTRWDKRWLFRRHLQRAHKIIAKNPSISDSEGYSKAESRPMCVLCNLNFESKTILKQHNLITHGTNRSIHYCKLCDKTFDSKRSLHKHLYKFHFDLEPADNSCIFCSQIMGSLEELKQHKTTHEKIFMNCKFCGVSFDHEETMNGHIRNVHFFCNLCEIQLIDRDDIILHITNLHSSLEFPCSLCGKVFLTKSACKIHVESFHEKIKKYECTHCDYKTNNQSTFKCHVEGLHNENKEYFCDLCDFKTSWENYLKLHIKAEHLGSLFECPHCEYKSKYKLNVKNHIKGMHTREKHACSQCEKEFNWLQALKQHVEIVHEGLVFSCPLCPHVCTRKNRLDQHMTKKHGVSFDCANCSFSTVKKKLYVEHKRRCRKDMSDAVQEELSSDIEIIKQEADDPEIFNII